ncbi:MAG: hypothetical protein SNJ73_06655 [Acetobacteraceae bacterium]
MVKASLLVFLVFTVLVAWGLKRRRAAPSGGLIARKSSLLRLWFDAAAISVGLTLALLAGMHWLRLGWMA